MVLMQLWQQYDESGKIEMIAFDFKGNLLSKKQLVISSATLKSALDSYTTYLVDWTGLPSILGTQEFETSSEFDALNRATKITLPEDVNTDRKEIIPTYNRAGALEKVAYDSTEYVKNIVYNAKGQRLLITFGNDIMTRYAYDTKTFRLLRQRSEKYAYSLVSETHTYTPDTGTKRQDDGFNFDLVGNVMKILLRVDDCGITGVGLGANALDRTFEYDPLYRVVSGNGRESDTQNQNDYLYSDAPAPGSPNANNVRVYARQYNYDKIGNVQQVTQSGTNGFTRNFVYNTGVNTLQQIETGSSVLIQNFTYDTVGNQITAGTTRNYVWNAGNQLITYYNQAGMADPTIFAQYDYSGMNRVSKMVRTGTAGSPIYERTIYIDGIFEYHILENGTTYEKNYVHVMDDQSRIAMVRIGTPFPDDITDAITYNLENQIGSSTVRLNTTGGVIDKEEYYPFGDSSLRTFTKKRYRYVGKEKDLESGLYYYGARYYAAWTCRFISVDPLAADYPYLTPYNNAGNKPITFKDIDGMQSDGDTPVKQDNSNQTSANNSGNEIESTDNISAESGDNNSTSSYKFSLSIGGPIPYIAPFSNFGFALYRSLWNDSPNNPQNYDNFDYIYNPGWKMDEPSSAFNVIELAINKDNTKHNIGLGGYHYKMSNDTGIFHYGGGINQVGVNYSFSKPSSFSSRVNLELGAGLGFLATIPKIHGDKEMEYEVTNTGSPNLGGYELAGYAASATIGLNINVLENRRFNFDVFFRGHLNYFNLKDFNYQNKQTGQITEMYGFQNAGYGLILGARTSINFKKQ